MSGTNSRRCSATTRDGRPCRQNPLLGSDPPLCMIHAGLSGLQKAPPEGRCTAKTRQGRRCRQWAVNGSEPPRCSEHAGLTEPEPERRCTASTVAGTRCRQWAIAGSKPLLCRTHAGRQRPPPEDRRCTAQLPGGRRCPTWAVRDEDPPLCATHSGRAGFKPGHRHRVTHGLYISRLSPEDLAGIEADCKALQEGRLTLDEELYACRWLVQQLAIATQPDRMKTLSVKQIERYVNGIFRGLETIAIILKAKRKIDAAHPTFPETP